MPERAAIFVRRQKAARSLPGVRGGERAVRAWLPSATYRPDCLTAPT